MSEEERLQLENELLLTCSKAQAINKYIDELEESYKLSELWCKSQQENKQLKGENKDLQEKVILLRASEPMLELEKYYGDRDKYKEVIEEVREHCNQEIKSASIQYERDKKFMHQQYIVYHERVLQILDKVKGE